MVDQSQIRTVRKTVSPSSASVPTYSMKRPVQLKSRELKDKVLKKKKKKKSKRGRQEARRDREHICQVSFLLPVCVVTCNNLM